MSFIQTKTNDNLFKIGQLWDHNPSSKENNWNINLIFKVTDIKNVGIDGILYNFATNHYQFNYILNNTIAVSSRWRKRPINLPGLFCEKCLKFHHNADINAFKYFDMNKVDPFKYYKFFICWNCEIK